MPYRSDEEAADARRLELERELGDLRSRVDQAEYLRQKNLETELAALQTTKASRDSARRLSLLASAKIASVCFADWEKMAGDDRTRFCSSCQKNVYNLSALTTVEAEALLREKEGNLCARLFRRADGTVLTADCPVGLRRKWLANSVNIGLVASGVVMLAMVGIRSVGPRVAAAGSMGAVSAEWEDTKTTRDTTAGMVDSPLTTPEASQAPPLHDPTPHLQTGKPQRPSQRSRAPGTMVPSTSRSE